MGQVSQIIAAAILAAAASTSGARAADPPAATAPRPSLYLMESLRTGKLSPEIMQKLAPLQTLQQVEDVLKANRVTFIWRSGEVSSTDLGPNLVRQISQLPPHAVFTAPQGDGVVIAIVVSTRPAPDAPATATPATAPPTPK